MDQHTLADMMVFRWGVKVLDHMKMEIVITPVQIHCRLNRQQHRLIVILLKGTVLMQEWFFILNNYSRYLL